MIYLRPRRAGKSRIIELTIAFAKLTDRSLYVMRPDPLKDLLITRSGEEVEVEHPLKLIEGEIGTIDTGIDFIFKKKGEIK